MRPICKAQDLLILGAHMWRTPWLGLPSHTIWCVLPVIAYTLKTFKGVEHRIEYVTTINGVRWLNDSKGTNPDSTIKAIEAMTGPTVLIAGGYDKEISFQTLAEVIIQSGRIHHCVLFGQTAPQIKDEALQGYHAVRIAEPGGSGLISAKARLGDTLLSPAWHPLTCLMIIAPGSGV